MIKKLKISKKCPKIPFYVQKSLETLFELEFLHTKPHARCPPINGVEI